MEYTLQAPKDMQEHFENESLGTVFEHALRVAMSLNLTATPVECPDTITVTPYWPLDDEATTHYSVVATRGNIHLFATTVGLDTPTNTGDTAGLKDVDTGVVLVPYLSIKANGCARLGKQYLEHVVKDTVLTPTERNL